MVEKALEEALLYKVAWDGSEKSSIPKHLCLPSEATTAIAQCSVCSAFAHPKERWSDSGDCPLGVNSRQGDYFKIDKRQCPQRQCPQRQWQQRRQQDEDGRTRTARQRRWWRRKKPAADLVISIHLYLCPFFNYFAVLMSYLSSAMLFLFLFLFFSRKFYFWRTQGRRLFLTSFRVNSQKLTRKLKNFIFSWSAKFRGYFNPILSF